MINNLKKLVGIYDFSKEEYGYLCIYLVTFVPLIYKFISPFFIIAGLGNLTIFINPIILICGLMNLKSKIRIYIRPFDVILYCFISGLLFLTPFLFPANSNYFDLHYTNFVFFTLSFYFIGLTLDYSKCHSVISAVAKIGVWYMIYWQTLVYLGIVETANNYDGTAGEQMSQAYYILFSIFVLFVDIFKKPRLVDIIYLIISILLLLFMGTRGPVLILAIFVATYLIIVHKFASYNILKKTVIVACLIMFIFYLEILLMAIIPVATALGFSTRVFDSIVDGRMMDISESSGRDDLWNILTRAIETDHGGIGYGWLGDRLLLNGSYSHNFELEILVQFGTIIGGGILLLLLFLILKSYFNIKKSSSRDFWLLMLFVGLIELQLSSTYINHPLLFIMIGYFVSIKRKISM